MQSVGPFTLSRPSEQYKLRTVIWDFAGEAIPTALLEDLEHLAPKLEDRGSLRLDLARLLSSAEIEALRDRIFHLLSDREFPELGPQQNYPWPLV